MFFPPVAVLDACVLYGQYRTDTLVRLAIAGCYRAVWSPDILAEVRRNVGELTGVAAIDRRIQAMNRALPDATIFGYDHLVPEMTNDPKDRHVLAAAVHADAECIVTYNLNDFGSAALRDHEIEALHPDEFLLSLLHDDPDLVTECLTSQVRAYRKPPRELEDLLDVLARGSELPRFADAVRQHVDDEG